MKIKNPYEQYAKLTVEESQYAYARYYYRPFPGLPEEQESILDSYSNMTAEDALLPCDIPKMLHPEKIRKENGYCLLPGGGGYVAALHQMPDITFEMYKWWNEWRMRGDENGRYKIWCPGKHILCHNVFSSEEIGGEVEEIYFQEGIRDNPSKIGLDKKEMEKAGLLMADGGGAWSKKRSDAINEYPVGGIVIHFIYRHKNGRGITMRSRFWKGFSIGDGIYPSLAPGQSVFLRDLRGLFEHNCIEMEYLNTLLPSLYKDENGNG